MIGPSAGIRMVFDAASIIADSEEETDRPRGWRKVEQIVFDTNGKVVGRQPFPPPWSELGAGEVLANCRSKDEV